MLEDAVGLPSDTIAEGDVDGNVAAGMPRDCEDKESVLLSAGAISVVRPEDEGGIGAGIEGNTSEPEGAGAVTTCNPL